MLYILTILLITGVCVLLYGWRDTNRFDVRKTEIELERLPEAFYGFTILQVSDLHNRAYGRDGRAMMRALERLPFDIIAITGDLLDRHTPDKRDNGYRFAQEAAKYAPALELVFGCDVITALVLTGACDLFTWEPIGKTDAVLPVCSGDMLFNVFNEVLGFLA